MDIFEMPVEQFSTAFLKTQSKILTLNYINFNSLQVKIKNNYENKNIRFWNCGWLSKNYK